jgi:hypothetical protein
MPNCGCSGQCTCLIQAVPPLSIIGSGAPTDPLVISIDVGMVGGINQTFEVTLTGTGTEIDPWTIAVNYAPTAKLDHIPDVDAPAPTHAQVLGYDGPSGTWKPFPPVTATPGLVSHDTTLAGDGSVGTPLAVVTDDPRYVETTATGVGVTDPAINQWVRHFADATARTAAVPTPELNTLSMLNTVPGVIDYWDGTAWKTYRATPLDIVGQFLEMSGPYVAGTQVALMVRQVADTTDGSGVFEVLSVADLTGRAGVLSVQFQVSGSLAPPPVVSVVASTDHVDGIAYRGDDGLPYAGQLITGTVLAMVY